METVPLPEEATGFLAAPATRLEIEKLLSRQAVEGGFVFYGPDGIGKATLGYLLAATVISGGRSLGETDPKVRSLIAAGSHPDVHVLRRTEHEKTGKLRSEIGVDQVRAVIAKMHQRSVSGRSVVIVDLADELRREAANSLLKLLEEPPAGAALFLLSRSPSRLLPTLTSRCRKIALRPVAEAAVAQWLSERADLPGTESLTYAREANGAPGRALRLATGDGVDAKALADSLERAIGGRADLLNAARKFTGKDTELMAEEARELLLNRLRLRMTDPATDPAEARRHLEAYDRARALFDGAGTADRTQTAYLAGLAIQEALAGA